MWNKLRTIFVDNKVLAFVTFVQFLCNFITIISGLIIAKWLIPEELGRFNVLSIVSSYIILIQVGIPSGLSRELPYYFGKNNSEKAISYASTSKFFLLLLSGVVFILSFISCLYFLFIHNFKYAIGSIVVGTTTFQTLYVTKYLRVLFISENQFKKLAKIDLINTLLSFFLLILVYYFTFYGLCLRAIILVAVNLYLTNKWKPLDCKAFFDTKTFWELFKVGMPIYIVANAYSLWPTFQGTFVLATLGTKGLGLFALSAIAQGMLSTFSNSISSICFPLMSKMYGSGHNFLDIIKVPLKPFLLSLCFYAIALITGWNFLPKIIEKALPNYIKGVEAAQWMFLVAMVSSFSVFSNIFMVLRKNHHRLVGYILGIGGWFLYLIFCEIKDIEDLVLFSKAVLFGTILINLSDFTFYLLYWHQSKFQRC